MHYPVMSYPAYFTLILNTMSTSIQELLATLAEAASTNRDKGTQFERLIANMPTGWGMFGYGANGRSAGAVMMASTL